MTISVLQERNASATAGLTLGLAFNSNVTANSSIHVAGICSSSSTMTCADNVNGTYGAGLDALVDSNVLENANHFQFSSAAAGATTVTLTFSVGANEAISIREIGGTSGFDSGKHAGINLQSPGTGTDAIATATVAPSTQPGLLSAFIINDTAAHATLASGTNFTQDTKSAWGTLGQELLTEHRRYTATTAIASTATDATNGAGDSYFAMGAFFKESAAAANPFTPIATNSAPQSKQIGSASLLHNLLLTTLAAVAIAIPIGKQLSTSAPPPKYQTQVDISPNTLLRGIPQPIPFKTDHFTRPQQRYEVVAEQYTNRLLLGIPKPIPYNFYGFENPKQKYEVIAEQYTNRLLLGIPGPIPYKTYHFTAPQQKWSVVAEQYVNNLVLGLPVNPLPRVPTVFAAVSAKPLGPAEQWPNLTLSTLATTVIPIPQGKVLTDSAPQPKYQIQVDRFPDTLLQGIPQPIPFNLYGFDAAKLKYSVTFDTFPNTVLTGIPQPIPFKTDHFTTPQQKWPVVAEQYQNRLTLGLPAPSIALPQGAQLPTFTAQQKFSVVADQFVNTLILGIPVNPVVRVPIVFASISAKPLGAVEQWPNLLLETLGIKNPLPQGAQLYDSAPPLKAATAPPLFPARGFQPVAVPIPLPLGLPVDVSQWQGKYQLLVDGPPNLVLSTLLQVAVAIPQGKVVSDSAPSQKYQVQVDQPQNLLLSSFLFLKNPAWIDFDPVPFQAQHYETNDPPNLLLTNLASAQPIPIRLNDQPDSPQAKYTVQVDAYPNLNTSTFALPPNPIPIGERGANAWLTQLQQQLKFEVVDVNLLWPNSQLPNTIPAPVITASYRVFGPRTSDKSVHRRNQNSVPFGKVSRDLS